MLLSLEINNWNNCIFKPIICIDISSTNQIIHNNNEIIELHGSCFCGKSTIFKALKYLVSIIVDKKQEFVESDIRLLFSINDNIYDYHLKTNVNIIVKEEMCNVSTSKEIINSNRTKTSLLTSTTYPDIYMWFKNLIFIIPFHNESQLNEDLVPMISDGILNKYEKYIYPHSECFTEMHYKQTLTNDFLCLSRNRKSRKFCIKDLSFSLKELLFWLPTIHDFIYSTDNKVLIVDDIDTIANGLIKTVLEKEYIGKTTMATKQLIVSSNKETQNVFLKTASRIVTLSSFI